MAIADIPESRLNPIDEPDVSNATYIRWQGVNPHDQWETDFTPLNKRRWYRKLDEYNGGGRNGTWWNEKYRLHLENRELIRTFSSQLELTHRQRNRAEWWFLSLNLEKWGYPKDIIAYCLCAYIVHSDEQDCRKCHPSTPEDSKDPLFAQMEERLGIHRDSAMGKSKLGSVYAKIHSYVASNSSPLTIDPFDKYLKFEGVEGPFIPDGSDASWWYEGVYKGSRISLY